MWHPTCIIHVITSKIYTVCDFLQENSAILKRLVALRAQKSSLLGFTTHADFVLEMNMAKSGKKVASFLGGCLEATRRPGRTEPDQSCRSEEGRC